MTIYFDSYYFVHYIAWQKRSLICSFDNYTLFGVDQAKIAFSQTTRKRDARTTAEFARERWHITREHGNRPNGAVGRTAALQHPEILPARHTHYGANTMI